ncbi:O-antigen polymerase [Exiguobacterium chiriqhucha]|uniref:O-antigen polymerase n=1 Tax=Exiguobacterium chiriqhucha TaxID=1385984 RepID=UPI0038BB59FC
MVIGYILYNILIIKYSITFYGKKVNPISLYSYVWCTIVLLYELKWIEYYDLTLQTWTILFMSQTAYVMGCYLATKITLNNYQMKKDYAIYEKDAESYIFGVIVLITIISGIVILLNVFQYFSIFGYNLLSQTNELYSYRLSGSQGISKIPYIGVFIYIAMIFSAVYTVNYGFKKFFIIPFLLIILDELTSGGRASLVLAPLMFFGVFFAADLKVKLSKIQIGSIVLGIFLLFISISSNRTAGIYNIYSSDLFKKMTNDNVTFYKIIEYITSPLGTLNAFLASPTFSFGGNTFMTIYSILNKLGYNIEILLYQEDFYVPMRVNVGTMLREIIEDFMFPGAILVLILTGFIFSKSYLIFNQTYSYLSGLWVAVLFQIISFSFFDWRMRSSAEWIILFFGSLIGYFLDYKLEKRKNNKYEKNVRNIN